MKRTKKLFIMLMMALFSVSLSTKALAAKPLIKDSNYKEKKDRREERREERRDYRDDRNDDIREIRDERRENVKDYYKDCPKNNGKAYGLDKNDKYRKDCDIYWKDKDHQERAETIMKGTADVIKAVK